MTVWERINSRLGALPARRVTWTLVLVFSVWAVLDVFVFKLSSGLAQSSFDAMVRTRVLVAAPDPRVLIIDIDEASLARMGKEFGRWPWPRDTLATVLNHLERQHPAAVVWDVLFADADRLSPGGDAAFNEAVKQSPHSHFSVVRLPPANDASSQVTQAKLPGLWQTKAPSTATVALIPPALVAAANGRLGFNNGEVDADGVLRRYRFLERLADGSAIQSIAMSVHNATNNVAIDIDAISATDGFYAKNGLISWRSGPNVYPHISFADVFAQAEGGQTQVAVPSFTGKVVIIGSTAPSLHDIHPTPLSPTQAGVDTLATVIDNAMNRRHIAELPRGLQAALAVAMCIGLALWVQFKSVTSLAPALLALPVALLGISYLSLNGFPWFIDLHLSAGLALMFLAALRYWSALRRNYWCTPPDAGTSALALWPLMRSGPWLDADLDRLIDALAHHAPRCRVLVCDAHVVWPATLRWPELSRFAAVLGPQADVLAAGSALESPLRILASQVGEPVLLSGQPNRVQLADHAQRCWATLQATDLTSAERTTI